MLSPPLRGRVVAVTGAGGRLGRSLVETFALAGATIAALVPTEAEARAIALPPGADGWAFLCDVTDEVAVRGAFDAVHAQLGGLDVLLHAVGGWEASPLQDTTRAAWDRMLALNLTSAFLCFREASRLMTGRKGRLIAIAARQGADRGVMEQAAYSAAKAGVVRLVESVAAEYQGHVTAHVIAPSTLTDDGVEGGVPASDVARLCLHLCTGGGDALNGATLRAYGLAG